MDMNKEQKAFFDYGKAYAKYNYADHWTEEEESDDLWDKVKTEAVAKAWNTRCKERAKEAADTWHVRLKSRLCINCKHYGTSDKDVCDTCECVITNTNWEPKSNDQDSA